VSYCERHFVILYTQPHYQLNYVRVFVYITDGFTQELGFYYSSLNSETNNLKLTFPCSVINWIHAMTFTDFGKIIHFIKESKTSNVRVS